MPESYESSLSVPLIAGKHVIGALRFASTMPDYFTADHARFVKSLAGHAAISIDNANLLVARERQIDTLSLLRELSLDALSVIDVDQIYDAVLKTALILLGGIESSLIQVDRLNDTLTPVRSLKVVEDRFEPGHPLIPDGILRQAIHEETPVIVEDVDRSEIYQQFNQYNAVTYQSLMILPMVRRDEVHELLSVGFSAPRRITEDVRNVINLLSAQVASHIENAALNATITRNNDQMRAILDSTRDGIILLDVQGRIRDANEAAELLTQVPLRTLLNEPFARLADNELHQNPNTAIAWKEIIDDCAGSFEHLHQHSVILQHSEDPVHVLFMVAPVMSTEGKAMGNLIIIRDITEEKEVENFRETMQSMLVHDLKGPLTAMITSMYVADAILDDPQSDSVSELVASIRSTVDASLKSAEDMLRQVDTLRDLPLMGKKQMQVEPTFNNAYQLAYHAFEALAANFIEAGISVNIEIDREQAFFVDASLIHRVLVNLLHNAFKFTPEGGRVLIKQVAHGTTSETIELLIADTGPGIPEMHRESIFGQFIQIEGLKPRTGGKGTGLGLAFCKLAVEAHGGQIRVTTDSPLSGACFAFTLPIADWRDQQQDS